MFLRADAKKVVNDWLCSGLGQEKLRFSKANRLQTPADFQAVFNQPLRSRSVYFTALALPRERESARLGVVVAKKVIRKAVRRNWIRRIIRESFRLNQTLLEHLDIVVLVRCVLPKEKTSLFFNNCLQEQWESLAAQAKRF